MQYKHVLLHIYVKIIKFDLSNCQLFLWLSGVVQGLAYEFESRSGPFFLRLDILKMTSFFFLVFVKSPYV